LQAIAKLRDEPAGTYNLVLTVSWFVERVRHVFLP
jgi:hypothetical protein